MLVKYLNVNVEDNNEEDISPYFAEVFEFLTCTDDEDEKRVLFHCRVGVSRSATLLIAFMMRQHAMTLREAYDLVKSRRARVQPTDAFTDALLKYETEVFPERESEISFKYMTGYTSRPNSMVSKNSSSSLPEVSASVSESIILEGEEDKDKEGGGACSCSCCSIS
jgi:hypothetical protein